MTVRHDVDVIAGRLRIWWAIGGGATRAASMRCCRSSATCHGIALLRHAPPRALDMTASFGERLSSAMPPGAESVAAVHRRRQPSIHRDRRCVHPRERHLSQDQPRHPRRVHPSLRPRTRQPIPIVTGFIGATGGRTDDDDRPQRVHYSAAIVGAALGASVINLDRRGRRAQPTCARCRPPSCCRTCVRRGDGVVVFGARVLHSASIAPAVARGIPILIKNTHLGARTLISKSGGD
jgi:aspartokinase